MSLKEISLQTKFGHEFQKAFNVETWAVSELFWSKLKTYDTGSVQKCNVIVSDVLEDKSCDYSRHVNVRNSRQLFNFCSYFDLRSKYDKKFMQLEALHKGMQEIAISEGWDINFLKSVYDECMALKLENTFFVTAKHKNAPNRQYKAGIWCCWDIDLFEAYLVVFDKSDEEIYREKFVKAEPHNGDFIYYTNLKWTSNHTVSIESSRNNNKWIINLEGKLPCKTPAHPETLIAEEEEHDMNWHEALEKIYEILDGNNHSEISQSLREAQLISGIGGEILLSVSAKLTEIKETMPDIYCLIKDEAENVITAKIKYWEDTPCNNT